MLNSTPSPHPIPTSTRTPTQVRISKQDCQPAQALKLRLREGEGEWRTAYEGPPPGAESSHRAEARRSGLCATLAGVRGVWDVCVGGGVGGLVRHGRRLRYRRH